MPVSVFVESRSASSSDGWPGPVRVTFTVKTTRSASAVVLFFLPHCFLLCCLFSSLAVVIWEIAPGGAGCTAWSRLESRAFPSALRRRGWAL